MQKPKVLVAMSGGVDSSVAALLMKKHGFDIVGCFMKNWSDTKNEFGECTWKDDRKIAMKIAARLGIPLITLDFEKQYRKIVIDPMFNLYKRGITPNQDIDCNQKLKFPLLWKAAKKLGASFIVTGHYARIKRTINNKKNKVNEKSVSLINEDSKYNYELLRAKDETKDQSYFLYRLSQDDLKHSLFPIGDYTKKGIRKIAEKNGFENFNRKGTVGICFVGKVKLKSFLQKKIKPKTGKILDPNSKIIGEHDGVYYYTIGQRIGPRYGIEIEKKDKKGQVRRWYVAKKVLKTNTIIAAPENNVLLFRKEILIKNPHWISENEMKIKPNINLKLSSGLGSGEKSIKVLARIRQVGELLPSRLLYKNGRYEVILNKPITGVSEGQAVVLYKGKKVLGGGVISLR